MNKRAKLPYMGPVRVYADIKDLEMSSHWIAVREELAREPVGGVFLPDLKNNTIGTVLKAGDLAVDYGVGPGDRVVYREWQGGRWVFGDAEAEDGLARFLIMSVGDVLVRIEEE